MKFVMRFAAPLLVLWLALVGCDTLFTETPPRTLTMSEPPTRVPPAGAVIRATWM